MWQTIRQFSWRNGVFSLKTFVAAMLALYIAMRLNLSQPSWSVTTVYVVSQPLAGMVLAKSLYRILGTLIGAAMSLTLVSLLSNTPELFCLALAAWIGLGAFVTIYLRDEPKAYLGMLSGYSAAVIGLPAALAPDGAFSIAVERCLEITLGIACGTLMHNLVFPQRAGNAMLKALDSALPSMARWAADALQGEGNAAKGLVDRSRIISTVVALDSLRVFAVLDTPALRTVDSVIRQFEGKLMSLLAVLMSVYDRFAILQRRRPEVAEALRPLLTRTAAHIANSAETRTIAAAEQESEAEIALNAEIDAQVPPPNSLRSDPDALLIRSILMRLSDVLAMWRNAVWLRTHIFRGAPTSESEPAPAFHPYRDVTLAVVGAVVTTLAVSIASAFWILSAWPNGETAVIFAGIVCAVMAARDDPVAASTRYLKMAMIGAAIGGLYLFVVLPPLSTFPALVVALAPFYLACGLLMTQPTTAALPMPMIFVGGALIGFSNAMTYDFATFINSAIGYAVGIGIAALTLALLRPLGAEWAVRRQMRGIIGDLAQIARADKPQPRSAFESRMFDRINALFMRLNPMIADQRAVLGASLASLRIGLNIRTLNALRAELPPEASLPVTDALAALAAYFDEKRRGRAAELPLAALNTARATVFACGDSPELIRAGESLYRIEATLHRHADALAPTTAESVASTTNPVTA